VESDALARIVGKYEDDLHICAHSTVYTDVTGSTTDGSNYTKTPQFYSVCVCVCVCVCVYVRVIKIHINQTLIFPYLKHNVSIR